ncbi:MAG: hypothetical protein F6K40_24795 [Okeania sp. SIO3I5]|uniref:P-loop NTPase fold protein n=1 Tax=Okeania sp. SIO3I5 TaxID=2607805 RepID=UPI0013BD8649|nr:P-loop NTPase fold protein [Okeania sp. SIO3I5]NEQ39294.1 hypothetical protein [Okeania sp. SIO3I5]
MEETTTPGNSENKVEEQLAEELLAQVEKLLKRASDLLPSSSEVLKDALNIAGSIEDEYFRSEALAALAPKLPETQRVEVLKEALNAAQEIKHDYYCSEALAALAPKLPETATELLKEALNVAQEIKHEYYRSKALAALAPKLPETATELLQESLQAAQQIQDEYPRSQVLAALAPKLPETATELLQESLQAAQQIQDEYPRSQVLAALALKLPETEPELLQQSLQAAQQIQDEYPRSQVLAALALKLPETERLEALKEALNAAQQIQDEYYRCQALAALALKLPETEPELLQQSLQTAQQIENKHSRSEALAALAPKLPETERLEALKEALNASQQIENKHSRSEALAALAPKLPETATELLKEALNTSQEIQDEYYRCQALAAITLKLPETEPELLQQSLQTAQQIENKHSRSEALAALALKLPETERLKVLKEAWNVAQSIQREKYRCRALEALAPQLPETEPELLQQALNTAQKIQNEWYRSRTLEALAPQLPETEPELLQQALNTAQSIQDEYYRSQALAAIAPKLPETNERSQKLKEAIEITEKISSDDEKVKALSDIAKEFLGFEYGLLQKILEIGLTIPNKALQIKVFNDVTANNFYHIFIAEELSKIEPILESDHILLILPLVLKLPENSGFKILTPFLKRFSEEIVQNLPKNKLPFALEIVEQKKFQTEDEVKTRFLSALAPRLSMRLFQGSLKMIEESIKDDGYRTDTFCNFAPYLPEAEFFEALEFIKQTIQDTSKKIEAFEQIIPHLSIPYLVEVLKILNKEETLFNDLDKIIILSFVSDSMFKKSAWEEIPSESQDDFQSLINDIINLTTEILNNKYDKEYHENILAIFKKLAPLLSEQKTSETLGKLKNINFEEKDEKQKLFFEILCVLAPLFPDCSNLVEECINCIYSETHQKIVKFYIPGWLEQNEDNVREILDSEDTSIDLALHLAINSANYSRKKYEIYALRKLVDFSDSPEKVLNKLDFFIPYLSYKQRFLAIDIARNPSKNYKNDNEKINRLRVEVLVNIASKFPEFRQEAIEEINELKIFGDRIALLSKLAIEIPELLLTILKKIRDAQESNKIRKQQDSQEFLLKTPQDEDEITERDRKEILESLAVHLPNRINREVKRNNNITTELWERAIKLLARSYRDALQAGSLRNESAQNEDYLNLKDEINSLSDLLLMRDLDPPMTVGILGGWGRGKSYIMHLMQSHITEVRSRAVTEEEAWNSDPNHEKLSPYVGHIYQIKFDAWTYAKSNLWASLMQTIFLELDRQISLEAKITEVLKQLDQNKRIDIEGKIWEVLYKTSDEDRKWFLERVLIDRRLLEDLSKIQGETTGKLWETLNDTQKEAIEQFKKTQIELEIARSELDAKKAKIRKEVNDKFAPLLKWQNNQSSQRIYAFLGTSFILLEKRIGSKLFKNIYQDIQQKLYGDSEKDNGEKTGLWNKLNETVEKLESARQELAELEKEEPNLYQKSSQKTDEDSDSNQKKDKDEIENKIDEFLLEIEATKFEINTVAANVIDTKSWNINFSTGWQWFKKNWLLLSLFLIFFVLQIILLAFFGINIINIGQANFLKMLTAIAALITPILPTFVTLRSLFRSGSKWWEETQLALHEYEKSVKNSHKNLENTIESKLKKRLQQDSELQQLEKNVSQLETQVKQQKQALPANQYASLNDFVSDRLSSKTYANNLGLMQQVKEDLSDLSNKLLPPKNQSLNPKISSLTYSRRSPTGERGILQSDKP